MMGMASSWAPSSYGHGVLVGTFLVWAWRPRGHLPHMGVPSSCAPSSYGCGVLVGTFLIWVWRPRGHLPHMDMASSRAPSSYGAHRRISASASVSAFLIVTLYSPASTT